MPHTTNAEKFGTHMASQVGNAANVAGEKLDAAIGYTRERGQALRDSVNHLVDDGWTELKGRAAKVPVAPLLIGIGAGFCLGWFVRRHTSENQ